MYICVCACHCLYRLVYSARILTVDDHKTTFFGQIFAILRIGQRKLLNVNFEVELQGKHGEDHEFYRQWADFTGNAYVIFPQTIKGRKSCFIRSKILRKLLVALGKFRNNCVFNAVLLSLQVYFSSTWNNLDDDICLTTSFFAGKWL